MAGANRGVDACLVRYERRRTHGDRFQATSRLRYKMFHWNDSFQLSRKLMSAIGLRSGRLTKMERSIPIGALLPALD
jgi:hypothetical protein